MADAKMLKKVPVREQDPKVRATNFEEVCLGYNQEEAMEEAQRCLGCKKPKCVEGCPVSINIPGFIEEIKEGKIEEAYKVIGLSSALPAICGRVCPQESQCEGKCIRGVKGEAVSIGKLERFVADYALEHDIKPVGAEVKNGHKVAVIGSGPSGLTCAGDLAKAGYDVTVFEALHELGGVLVYGIPEFRLPKQKVVKKEIEIFYSQLDEMKFTVHVCEPEKLDSKLSKSHLLLLKLIVETYKNGIGKEKLTDIAFQKSIYLFDILMNRDFFKFDKEKKGPFSKLTGVLYNELKKYKNISGLSLEEMSKSLEQKYTSETLEKEDRAIIKSIKLVNELYKLNSSDQEFEDQLELVTSILYLMNIENKSNEEEIVDGIISWNKRKKEKYDSNKIVNTIKYMQNENIIQKGIFQNYTINRI